MVVSLANHASRHLKIAHVLRAQFIPSPLNIQRKIFVRVPKFAQIIGVLLWSNDDKSAPPPNVLDLHSRVASADRGLEFRLKSVFSDAVFFYSGEVITDLP